MAAAAAPASASRVAACSRVAAFRDGPIPPSCSMGTAHAVISSSSAEESTQHNSVQHTAALPWQPLHPAAAALSRAAGASYHAVGTAGLADPAAAVPASLEDHHMLQQPQVVHFQQQPQHQQQHSHTAAGAASQRQLPPDAGLAEAWRAQHAAAISQWRLLSRPGQDETSCIILSCSSSQQLLGVAQELLKQPASKWHYARLAAMAAVLTAPQQTSTVGASQQATIQQQQQQHNAAAGQDLDLFVHWRGSNGNGSGSSSSSGVAAQVQHWQLGQHSSPVEQQQKQQQQQQQQQYGPCAHTQLACKVMEAVTAPCASSGVPALHAMWGAQLTEVLHAVQLLQQQQPGHSTLSEQHQPQLGSLLQLPPLLQRQQQRLQQVLAAMPEPALLSAVHGCTSVQQLQSVVALAGEWFSPLQLKAGFVQLARLVPASSSSSSIVVDVWQQLLAVLPLHLPALQPHQCASILWSMGQLQPTLGTSSGSTEAASASSSGSGSARQLIDVQQQLLQGALAGLERLNPRVCAQLLHGAARLQLQLPAGSLQVLQQHTQQQLQLCDPQALACMLWSFATLHSSGSSPGPNPDWLAAFYSSSWRWLQQSSSAPSHSNSNSTFSPHWQQRQERQQQWQHKDVAVCFEPVELSSLLTAVCRLQLQPPSGWLAAVADSSSRQIGSFQQQELGLVLWGFARLQYAPPRGFITAAASRLQQLGPGGFDPQVLSLLIYGATRLLCWHQPCEQQLLRGCERQVLAGGVAQLGQWSGHDLALLAWSLGRQQQQQQQKQQGRQQAQLLGDVLLPALVQASTAKLLQQQQFTPQGVSMLLWGLGTVLQASVAEAERSRGREASSSTSTSGSNGTSSSSVQPVPQNQQQEQQASAAALPDQAMLVALLEAASVAVTQHAKAFSGHELSQLVWGIGALARQAAFPAHPTSSSSSSRSSSVVSTPGRRGPLPVPAAAECLDLLFCQLLDASDHLSNYQLAAALQGFCWAHHPRGLDLLHLALQSRARNARAAAVQPQELLLFLRACTTYKHVPEGSAWAGVVAAADRVRTQLRPDELAQLLNLLGKLQMQSNRRARQRAAQAAAASAAEAAAAVSAWQTKHEQRRQAWMSTYHQKQQVLQHVAFEPLVPQVLLEQLVAQAAGCCFQHCSSRDVSLMLWGVSHLQRQHQHQLLSLPLQQQHHQWAGPDSSTSAATHAGPLAPLLGAVYPYTLQQLTSFAPGNLATLLYALHRLRARPEGAWLQAVALHFDEGRLSSMDGQSLAVLGLALAGLNWVPPKAWLGSYVRAVAAADRRGVLVTTWQRRCISNSLAALNPLAGHLWLP